MGAAAGDTRCCFSLPVLEFRPLTPAEEVDVPTCGLSIAAKGEAHLSSKLHFNNYKNKPESLISELNTP